MKSFLISCLVFLFITGSAHAQDSLLVKALKQNRYEFDHVPDQGFSGAGWEKVIKEANENQFFLIGEAHGINEIPLIIDALTRQVQFQTFVAEIDPWLAKILEEKVTKTPIAARQKWYSENNSFLSFFSYQSDFKLLETLAQRNVKFAGIDQITLLNDVPVYEHLAGISKSKAAKENYLAMAAASRKMVQEYTGAKNQLLYLPSGQFAADLEKLQAQKLSAEEKKVLGQLALSHQIYTAKGGHQRRINLMKQQLLQYYQQGMLSQKVLFRMGAMHSSRSESFFTIFDVGNLAHNLAESQNSTSYHVAILPKAGEAALPLKGMAPQQVKQEKKLSHIFAAASDTRYTYFDLRPVRDLLEKGKLTVETEMMRQTIKGYDGIIIVPVATPGQL